MAEEYKKFKAAAVQASPVFPMNRRATVDKACALIGEAGKNGAQLVVFPETFVPMYPNWSIDLQNPTEWAQNLFHLTREAIEIPGHETELLGKAAKKAGVYLCLGVNEKVKNYDGMLFNSLLFMGPDGQVMGRHRKLLPSNREKVFWHRGDGADIKSVYETELGRVGGLICYEHLQPLLKYALYAQGEQVHCACWPGWPHYPSPGRSNKHVIDVVTRSYALEGQCFVVLSSLYVPEGLGQKAGLGNAAWVFFGGSGIINPSGEYLAGPVYDQEDILYANIDLSLIPMRKAAVDTTGRDTRWDILSLNIHDGVYVPYRELGQAEMIEEREPSATADLMSPMGRMISRLDDLVDRLDDIIEKDKKRKK
jgi:predicted amidohydrolase